MANHHLTGLRETAGQRRPEEWALLAKSGRGFGRKLYIGTVEDPLLYGEQHHKDQCGVDCCEE